MAYTPPAHNEVDFDFTKSGYTAGTLTGDLLDMAKEEAPPERSKRMGATYKINNPPQPGSKRMGSTYEVLLEFGDPLPEFPVALGLSAGYGIRWSTSVSMARSGRSQRNINWSRPLHFYDAALGLKTQEDIESVLEFFHSASGRLGQFILKDELNFKSSAIDQPVSNADQFLGYGDGSNQVFKLTKTLEVGEEYYTMNVRRIVAASVVVAIDGSSTTAFVLDDVEGRILFNTAPVQDAVVTAGFEYRIPCRFEEDSMVARLENYRLGQSGLPIIEDRF